MNLHHHFGGRLPDRQDVSELLERIARGSRPARLSCTADPVVLYGAGELGQMARAWCRQHQVDVLGVVDARADRWKTDPRWFGLRVWAPEEVPDAVRRRNRLLLCISTLPLSGLQAALRSQGWAQQQPFYDFVEASPRRQSLNNGWMADPPEGEGLHLARHVLQAWCDDVSRAHHLQFLSWRCLREEWSFESAPVHIDQRYAIPEFVAGWREGERLLDAGAHHGQVLSRFVAGRPGLLAQAWAVEPDRNNREQLRLWMDTLDPDVRRRMEVHALALARRDGSRYFMPGQGYASRLWSDGSEQVPARAIDGLGWSPSFIKLHLEGGEWRALQGAVNTLRRCQPLLTLTVYHRRDGLYHIAHWLMRLLPDYEWRFRLHGWIGTAAVIYGTPPQRQA
jgi:FkbM family methyltransferase